MRLTIRTQALLLSAVPLLVLLFVFVLASLRSHEARQTAYWGQHSQNVLAATAAVSADAQEANAALAAEGRKHDPANRAALERALAKLRADAATVETLVQDNPEQLARARRISAIVERFIPIFRKVFEVSGDGGNFRRLEQSPDVVNGARDFNVTMEALDATERNLAISRFHTFSDDATVFIARLIAALVIGILLTVATMLLFGWRLVQRLDRLSNNVERLAEGEETRPLEGTDEIAQLDRQFRETTRRMRQEQAISSQLQRALLPQQLPTIAGIRIDASYRPAAKGTAIGGDWYDVFILSDETIGISLGDVTGHGLLAASTMALVRQSIQTAARYTHDAAAVLELVNRNIVDQGGAVVSAFFCILNTHTGQMQYAVAGHPAPITVRTTGTVGMLAGSGILLGVERNARYERFETHLEDGAALVLYTDGLVETFRGDYSRGVSLLIEAITNRYYNTSENIAEAIQNRVFEAVEPHDDSAILFVGITELGAPGGTLTRTWDVDAKDVSQARRLKRALLWHLGEYAARDEDLSSVELILGELLGNVARHTDGHAVVTLEMDRDRATLHVSDDGEPIPGVPDSFDEFAESGRGLFLVNALARDLRIARHPNGNHLAAELPITLSSNRVPGEYPIPPAFH